MYVLQLTIVLVLVTGPIRAVQLEANDIQSFLNALDSSDSDKDRASSSDSSQPTAGSWGVPDAVATVGKLFKYELPKGDNNAIGKFKVRH